MEFVTTELTDQQRSVLLEAHLTKIRGPINFTSPSPTLDDLLANSWLKNKKRWKRNKRLWKKFRKNLERYISDNDFSILWAQKLSAVYRPRMNYDEIAKKAFSVQRLRSCERESPRL